MSERGNPTASAPLEEDLFAIDADAELRKLGRGRFKTRGESVAEIVACAGRAGATEVKVEIGWRALRVRAPGARLAASSISDLATALDPRRSPGRRHLALEALEAGDGLGLIAPFADGPRSVSFEWPGEDGPRGIRFRRGRPPRRYRPGATKELVIVVRGRRRELAKQRRVIRRKCRFSPLQVELNGRPVSRGHVLSDCLIQVELPRGGPRGAVGIPLEGDLNSTTRTEGGIVAEERVRSAASGLVYRAVVEAPGKRARELADTLEAVARRLYSRLAAQHDRLDAATQQRVRRLLFDRARVAGDMLLLEGVHAFDRTAGEPLDLAAVREASAGGALFAIGDDEPVGRRREDGLTVLRLDPRARQFLERVAGIPLPAPPRRAEEGALRPRLGARLALLLERLSARLSPRPAPVDVELLDDDERAFVAAVSAAVDRPVEMADGGRRPSFDRGEGALGIGRENPLVRRMVAGYAADPSYLSPAIAVLTEGKRSV